MLSNKMFSLILAFLVGKCLRLRLRPDTIWLGRKSRVILIYFDCGDSDRATFLYCYMIYLMNVSHAFQWIGISYALMYLFPWLVY